VRRCLTELRLVTVRQTDGGTDERTQGRRLHYTASRGKNMTTRKAVTQRRSDHVAAGAICKVSNSCLQ